MRRCAKGNSGKPLTKRPRRKRKTKRRRIWGIWESGVAPRLKRDSSEMTVVTPTRKRKVGKTRSVGVQPFHAECSKGQYAWPPLLLTMIMKAMVMPRSTSRDSIRAEVAVAGRSTETVAIGEERIPDVD